MIFWAPELNTLATGVPKLSIVSFRENRIAYYIELLKDSVTIFLDSIIEMGCVPLIFGMTLLYF